MPRKKKTREVNLTEDLFYKQQLAFTYLTDNITTEIGYGGAASGGKTWLLWTWINSHCLQYPGVAYGVGRRELTILKKTTLNTFYKWCKHYEIPEDWYKYNEKLSIINWKNSSIVYLIDMAYQPSDPLYTRFGGYELTGIAIDESNESDIKGINILSTRIGRRENEKYNLIPKMLETFNPDKAHVYKRYYRPYKEEKLPDYRQFIPALPVDNPHTSPEYIKQLERSDEVTKQRLLYGNFEYDEALGKLFQYNKILDLFNNSHVPKGDMYISADAAEFGADAIIIILWCGFRIQRIICKRKQSVKQTAQDILNLARKHQVVRSNIVIDDDGIGKGVTTHIAGCKQFTNNASAKNGENFYNVQNQCLFYLAEYVNENKVYIEPDAIYDIKHKEAIIQELDVNKRDQKSVDSDGKLKAISKAEIKRIIGKSPDFRDALLMRMVYELVPKVDLTQAYITTRNDVENFF